MCQPGRADGALAMVVRTNGRPELGEFATGTADAVRALMDAPRPQREMLVASLWSTVAAFPCLIR
jgi:hypothetical protein